MTRILLVEDDADFAFSLERALSARFHFVRAVATAAEAYRCARAESYDLIILDLGLPDATGVDALTELLRDDPQAAVIVLTGRDDAATAVAALRAGAAHYLTKPVSLDELHVAVEHTAERVQLKRRIEASARPLAGESGSDDGDDGAGIGQSPAWVTAVRAIRAAAAAPRTPVLVTGESGTGKERCARLVHAWSERARGPFVTVNVASLAPTLLESELFGHEAGAFTGARATKRGVFELATEGTLFLDELGELPLDLQPKLLRVLDGHPVRRVGGEKDIHVDVRLVSATNRELLREVGERRFRLDLYHRVRVIEVALPPVRERVGDIELLAAHLLVKIAREIGVPPPEVTDDAMQALRAYPWPGNVRELRNALERAVVLGRGTPIGLPQLPPEIATQSRRAAPEVRSGGAPASALSFTAASDSLGVKTLEEATRDHVLHAFRAAGGNVSLCARLLGITRNTLRRHLKDQLPGPASGPGSTQA